MRLLEIFVVDRLCQRSHAGHGVVFEQVLIVEMVEEDVESFFRVGDVGLEGWWSAGFDTLHVLAQNFIHGARVCRDVATVASWVFGADGGAAFGGGRDMGGGPDGGS